jgi:chaperone modulatory protein CbpM
MAQAPLPALDASIVDDAISFTLVELCRASGVSGAQIVLLVEEGVLQPQGDAPESWRFPGTSLHRARKAMRLARDFELGAAQAALVLALLEQIDELRARLWRAGLR